MRRGGVYQVVVMMVVIGIAGCQPKQERSFFETQDALQKAAESLEIAQRINSEGQYQTDVEQAQSAYTSAEANLNERKLDDAYLSAMRSLHVSKAVLTQYFVDRVARLAGETKTDIEAAVERDPDTPVKDFLPQLDNILAYANELQSGQQELSTETFVELTDVVTQISETKQELIEATLESDFSFDPGKYQLNRQGEWKIQEFSTTILQKKDAMLAKYLSKTVFIKIKATGYTDETPFREGTELVQSLTADMADVPAQGDARRQFLNQRLSTFRAQTIADFITNLIATSGYDADRVTVETEVVGNGEQVPTGVEPPYPTKDDRRRICKIYSYVIAK